MGGWSEGYFTDVQYTDYFFPQMAPGYLRMACLLQGVRAPDLGTGSSYLELGCGRGYGLNLLAAANPGMSFVGVDFHPGQIANATHLAKAAGLSNVAFEDFSFAQMLEFPESRLPRMDVVALHGVLSWVSRENHAAIVQIIDRVLKPGGLVYISYNTLPGWQPYLPVQRLFAEQFARAAGDAEARLSAALKTARQLVEGGARFFEKTPSAKQVVDQAQGQTPAYLLHEYLNADYHAFYHADVAALLDGARLSYAAAAIGAEDIPALAAPAALHPLIMGAQDMTWRQTLLDFASDKGFRRDVFVRGRNELDPRERLAILRGTPFTLLNATPQSELKFTVRMGSLSGDPAIYRPILEGLADGPKPLGELMDSAPLRDVSPDMVLRAVTVLLGATYIHPVANHQPTGSGAAFNRAVLSEIDYGGAQPNYISAPLAGAGVRANLTEITALRSIVRGDADPARAAREAVEVLSRSGASLQKDGKALNDPAEAEAELVRRINGFRKEGLRRFECLNAI